MLDSPGCMAPSRRLSGGGAISGLVLDAMPFTKTVACDTKAITGSATGTTTDASASSTSLLLKMSGRQGATTVTDQSATPKTMTMAGGANLDTATKKYGSGSTEFTRTGTERISTPDSADFTLGSGDWTIEAYVRFTTIVPAAGNYPTIAGQRNSANVDHAWTLEYNGDTSELEMVATTDGTVATLQRFASSWSPSINTWYHVAIARSGSSVRLFVDGSQIGTTKTFSGTIWDSSALLSVGNVQETGSFATAAVSWGGFIDEVRITKGVGRYTGTFTPAELPPEEVWWRASPSTNEVGTCTGTASFSCVVAVAPDTAGDGIETITVTQAALTDTETIGFYVALSHTCFLAQNINGTYNTGLSNADAVATWENLGSSALDVTQGTGSAQPSYRTSVVGGQPVVRCDGGDRVAASTAADWIFLGNGTDTTTEIVEKSDSGTGFFVTTSSNDAATAQEINIMRRTSSFRTIIVGATTAVTVDSGAVVSATVFDLLSSITDDDGGAGIDVTLRQNDVSRNTAASTAAYATSAATPLNLCASGNGSFPLTGDLFRVLIYQSALTSTQRGINKAVDEWALGGTLPVTP
jgi:hypothetical protein